MKLFIEQLESRDTPSTISGTVYLDAGITHDGAGLTVDFAVNGAPAVASATTDANGVFSADVPNAAGDVLAMYLQGDPSNGVRLTMPNGADLGGADIYESGLILSRGNTGYEPDMTLVRLARNGDSGMTVIYTSPTASALIVTGDLYAPDARYTSASQTTVSGNVALGVYGSVTNSFTLNGTGVQTADFGGGAIGKLTVASGEYSLVRRTLPTGGVQINAGATLNAPALLQVNRSWSNHGTFNADGGTVTFYNVRTVSGDTTFNNLTVTQLGVTLTFDAGSTTTIAGNLSMNGGATSILKLRSSIAGQQWFLDIEGTQSLSYLDVQDSDAIGAAAIAAFSTDSGDNTNWTF